MSITKAVDGSRYYPRQKVRTMNPFRVQTASVETVFDAEKDELSAELKNQRPLRHSKVTTNDFSD